MRNPPLRILHIGNIGNNGYQNARILNEAGYSCDVLCHQYYHIMSCPEWEDAVFDSLPTAYDEGNPDWSVFRFREFQRPKWFAQGPLGLCCRYLEARRSGHSFLELGYAQALALYMALRSKPRVLRQLQELLRWARVHLSGAADPGIRVRLSGLSRRFRTSFPIRTGLGIRRLWGRLWPTWGAKSVPQGWTTTLPDQFRAVFPERGDQLSAEEVAMFLPTVRIMARLFSHYDVVIGYSTDPIYPMIAGHRCYVAYEHGTLRAIPFEKSPVGRLTALAYRLAAQSFITNADCIGAAHRLGLPSYRFVPHPMNDRSIQLADGTALRRQLAERHRADYIVFHPARLHWELARHPSWEKGNDIFLRGFARFVREVAPRALVVLVRWGKCVKETEELLISERIADRVEWIRPVPNRTMLRYMKAADAVADQFWLGAFGGITPKAMACARPVLLHLDPEVHRWCFPELPPILQSRTPEDVFESLRRMYREPEFAREMGARSLAWYQKYHSESVIRERLVAVLRETCVDGRAGSGSEIDPMFGSQ